MSRPVDIVKQPGAASTAGDELLELVHAVVHRHRHRMLQALRDGAHTVTHLEARVLGFFGRCPGATPGELALHSGRDKAQLARLIKGLRERGLLCAAADAADRRQIRLSLTADGEAVQRVLRSQARRLNGDAVAGLSSDERAQLLSLLQRVRANLEPAAPV